MSVKQAESSHWNFILNFIFKHTMKPGLVENAYELLCKGPDTLNL